MIIVTFLEPEVRGQGQHTVSLEPPHCQSGRARKQVPCVSLVPAPVAGGRRQQVGQGLGGRADTNSRARSCTCCRLSSVPCSVSYCR